MNCREIMSIIEESYPQDYAMDWDHVGLQVGRMDREISTVYIALDATEEIIQQAIAAGADLLITHHPLIFSPMDRVVEDGFVGSRVLELIHHDISYYAMHTNYDVGRMGVLAAEKIHLQNAEPLEVTIHGVSGNPASAESVRQGEVSRGIGCIGTGTHPLTLEECCQEVKDAFSLTHVKVFGEQKRPIRRIAILPGSGKSDIDLAIDKEADVLITGDIGHHEGIDAVARGLAVIDAGHYGIEHIFMADMKTFLEQKLGGEISIVAAPIRHPFEIL